MYWRMKIQVAGSLILGNLFRNTLTGYGMDGTTVSSLRGGAHARYRGRGFCCAG